MTLETTSKGQKTSVYRSKDQQWALVTHRYTKLQQGHADDIIGAVAVADRERLGLKSVGILQSAVLICDVKCHKLARRRREKGSSHMRSFQCPWRRSSGGPSWGRPCLFPQGSRWRSGQMSDLRENQKTKPPPPYSCLKVVW